MLNYNKILVQSLIKKLRCKASFLLITWFLCLPGVSGWSQSNPENSGPSFLILTSQNDLYQAYLRTDKHFTNGAHIQWGHPKLNNSFFRSLLAGNRFKGDNLFVASLGQDILTPENYNQAEIDSTDRPYAGLLYGSIYRIIGNSERKEIFRSGLMLGVMGPASGAEKTQNFIHRLLGNEQAAGWVNQLGNGLILDYAISYRKGLIKQNRFFDFSGSANANFGTILNFASLGGQALMGKFNNPYKNLGIVSDKEFTNPAITRKGTDYQAFITMEAYAGYIIYNGTLSGSLISFKSSPYRIGADEVAGFTYGFSYGVTLSFKSFVISYQHRISKNQYALRDWHGWGELSLMYVF